MAITTDAEYDHWRAIAAGVDLGDVDAQLATLVDRPAWQRDALCAEYPAEWWFPGKGSMVWKQALSVCGRCPVLAECHDYAVSIPERIDGIWAGTTARVIERERQHENARATNGGAA